MRVGPCNSRMPSRKMPQRRGKQAANEVSAVSASSDGGCATQSALRCVRANRLCRHTEHWRPGQDPGRSWRGQIPAWVPQAGIASIVSVDESSRHVL